MSQDIRCLRKTAHKFAKELQDELRAAGHVVTPAVWRECQRAGRRLAKETAVCTVQPGAEKNALTALSELLARREATDA